MKNPASVPVNIAVLVSGGGTNLQALIDAEKSGVLHSGHICLVVSNSSKAYALERAALSGIPSVTLSRKALGGQEAFENELERTLKKYRIGLIVLAGFLNILSAEFTRRHDHRIVNIHPSLIPSFCGEGYYGLHVHEAALKRGVKMTGATVHFVNEIPDGGEIIMQKAVPVLPHDTPEILQKRVMRRAEWILLPRSAELVCGQILAEEKEPVKKPERRKARKPGGKG